jgi:nitrite reductase/ring-hydroxylating ferredoxin subunit
MPQRHPVTALASIPAGSGKAFTIAGKCIAFFNVGGKIYAMDDICPHAGAPLSDGPLNDCIVTCPWHGIQFNVTNGKIPDQADSDAQATFPVFINGDQIEVEL